MLSAVSRVTHQQDWRARMRINRWITMAAVIFMIGIAAALASGATGDQTGAVGTAQADLVSPVSPAALKALETTVGVEIVQIQQRQRALYSTITSGAVILPGETVISAAARYEADQRLYYATRIAEMEDLARTLGQPQRGMLERTITDMKSAQEALNISGFQIDRLIVRGTAAAVDRLRSNAAILTVEKTR